MHKEIVEYVTTSANYFHGTPGCVEEAPNPQPPSEDPSWVMTGSCAIAIRKHHQRLLWFWRRIRIVANNGR